MNINVRAIQATTTIEARIAQLDWPSIVASLDTSGWTTVQGLLSVSECRAIATSYQDEHLFRSRIVMARHGFGRGEYKYFRYPLPELVARLRAAIYPQLVALANRWNENISCGDRFPTEHAEFITRCHDAGQVRPTPLLLKYGPGDYNCLHQDVYGEHYFPLQVAILLSQPQSDFVGGEFVVTEQRPRMQSRVGVVPLARGDAVIFAVRYRPVKGSRGTYSVAMRHGVSPVRSGCRQTLGIIFHDSL